MHEFEIKVLCESDWLDYKSIRLESLRESPDSFASTYETESLFSTEQWKKRLCISPDIHDAVAVAAMADQSPIGLLSCVIHQAHTKNGNLYQMWVSPKYRKNGVGTALLRFVKSWASNKGIERLILSVTTTNIEAVSLYKSTGFNSVGQTEPLRDGTSLKSQLMEYKLDTNYA